MKIRNYENFCNESNSLHDYNKDELFQMIGDTFSVDGILKEYKKDVYDELITFINTFNEEEHKQLWIGYKLSLGKIKEIPDDFNTELYSKTIKELSNYVQSVINKYMEKYKNKKII